MRQCGSEAHRWPAQDVVSRDKVAVPVDGGELDRVKEHNGIELARVCSRRTLVLVRRARILQVKPRLRHDRDKYKRGVLQNGAAGTKHASGAGLHRDIDGDVAARRRGRRRGNLGDRDSHARHGYLLRVAKATKVLVPPDAGGHSTRRSAEGTRC